ncbi:MAG: hypothetical protein IPK94_22780 [Saprospiraceae bacterium]|nr:hypothetical protein [Saprospiraceae bacterium]
MALDYNDKSGNRYAGMRIWDRPTNASYDYMLDLLKEIKEAGENKARVDSLYKLWNEAKGQGENGVERMFIGSKNEVAQIQLKDKKGNVRARLYIDDTGAAKMEFLDEKASVIAVFPR